MKTLIAVLLACSATFAFAGSCPKEMAAIDAKLAAGAKLADARPVKPSCSVVVALTLIRAVSNCSNAAIRARMASRCGPILGISHMIVMST